MLLVFSLYTEKAVRERYIYTICACAIFVYFTGTTHSVWRNVISNNCCRCLIKNSSVISHDWLDKIPFSFFHLSIVYIVCQFLWFFCCFFFFHIYSFFQLCQQRFLVSVYQRFLEAKQPSECHTALFFFCVSNLPRDRNEPTLYIHICSLEETVSDLLCFLDCCSDFWIEFYAGIAQILLCFFNMNFVLFAFYFFMRCCSCQREREIEREGK